MSSLPDAPATHRNREPILTQLDKYLTAPSTVLEIGSGTGQHAVHFASHLPHVTWIPTELSANLSGVEAWRQQSGLANLMESLVLDVSQPWPEGLAVDHIFTANTTHIMPSDAVERLFQGAGRQLPAKGYLFLYGPFKYDGQFTSASNAAFDLQLRQRAAHQGIRDIEQLIAWAGDAGMLLVADHTMPANNQFLVFQRTE
ncbi:DUF938 domain-containing protein [Kistimonas scapharcae]|uniref:DUF938 domain-containing protein n=1 Tax=Kistimonas scapharcae TaxID=1036133 RepID=A0ABP8V0V7_9GAMM